MAGNKNNKKAGSQQQAAAPKQQAPADSNGDGAAQAAPVVAAPAPSAAAAAAPMAQGATAADVRRRMPIVEALEIPPHKPQRRNIFAAMKYKFYAETAMGTLEPWERAITNTVIFAIVLFTTYHSVLTAMWVYGMLRGAMHASSAATTAAVV